MEKEDSRERKKATELKRKRKSEEDRRLIERKERNQPGCPFKTLNQLHDS